MINNQETIAAIATAPGRGGVGIIRVSGPLAKSIGEKISGKQLKPRFAHYGNFIHPLSQELIDQGLTLFFPKPHSFTGEDVLELQGHGGPVVLDQLLNSLTHLKGIRLARPGEFSERAYLNDKIDLSQAEAIADIINASSEQAARNAVNTLQGVFSDKVNQLVQMITELRIFIEAAIDFPEEEIDFLKDKHLIKRIQKLKEALNDLFKQAQQGYILKEGMKVVIIGKPNAGKSSLLNALAGRNSAIVTDIPGTTRDVLREHIHLDGMPLHVIDTAGLREGGDEVERIGMDRAWKEIEEADQILLLVDASNTFNVTKIEDLIPKIDQNNEHKTIDLRKLTLVYNKSDLLKNRTSFPKLNDIHTIYISAKNRVGLDDLSQHLKSVMGYQQSNEGGFTARKRHLDALTSTNESVQKACELLDSGTGELVAEELRLAQCYLGEITGEITADDLLGKIFSSFCIGK